MSHTTTTSTTTGVKIVELIKMSGRMTWTFGQQACVLVFLFCAHSNLFISEIFSESLLEY